MNIIKIALSLLLVSMAGCTSTSKNIDLKEIRKTSDELYDLWWRGERWGREFEEL